MKFAWTSHPYVYMYMYIMAKYKKETIKKIQTVWILFIRIQKLKKYIFLISLSCSFFLWRIIYFLQSHKYYYKFINL